MHEDDSRVLVNTDEELDGKRKLDDYKIQKVAKYAVLVLALAVGLVITTVVLVAVISDKTWREYTIRATLEALPGIAAVVMVVLGLKKK